MQQATNDFLIIDGETLVLDDVIKVARFKQLVKLAEKNKEKIEISRKYVEGLVVDRKIVYGLTTGFGKFSDTYISSVDAKDLQVNLIRSHACGVGQPFSEEVVRAILLLRINALSLGYSGIRLKVIETMIEMLNKNVIPVIPEKGSLGASGDLAPLSHLALVIMGEGEAFYLGEKMEGNKAMISAGIQPISLEAKEGLALINGTQVMTAVGILACWDALNLAKWADCAASLSCEALLAISDAFEHLTHDIRPHQGQKIVASNLRALTRGSSLMTRQGELRVQDAYSIRCIPQVHGASRDAITHVQKVLSVEVNSATDNPLIFANSNQVISGGNFHGQPVALCMDYLTIAVAEYANISERRIERLVNPQLNENLPPFLTKYGGMHSGMMIAQYVAASLVSENKSLSFPASVDSIPSSANQEDHVSMGTIAARKAAQVIENAYHVIAIELLCGAQAIDFRGPSLTGVGTNKIYQECRRFVEFLEQDRVLSSDFQQIVKLMKNSDVLRDLEVLPIM